MPKIRTFHNVKLENKYIWFVKKEFFDQESIKGKDPSTISTSRSNPISQYHSVYP